MKKRNQGPKIFRDDFVLWSSRGRSVWHHEAVDGGEPQRARLRAVAIKLRYPKRRVTIYKRRIEIQAYDEL